MANQPDPVCITCGLDFDGRNLNRLRNGAVCPTCRDRLLDSLPALLPKVSQIERAEEGAPVLRAGSILRALPPAGPADD